MGNVEAPYYKCLIGLAHISTEEVTELQITYYGPPGKRVPAAPVNPVSLRNATINHKKDLLKW